MLRSTALAATLAALTFAAEAGASATPVGPLPEGPVTTIAAKRGTLVSVALRKRPGGKVWRLAGNLNPNVLHELSEADLGASVVVVFKAVGSGSTTLTYGLTLGDAGTKAYASATFTVHVS